jgi:hypothetical protein
MVMITRINQFGQPFGLIIAITHHSKDFLKKKRPGKVRIYSVNMTVFTPRDCDRGYETLLVAVDVTGINRLSGSLGPIESVVAPPRYQAKSAGFYPVGHSESRSSPGGSVECRERTGQLHWDEITVNR